MFRCKDIRVLKHPLILDMAMIIFDIVKLYITHEMNIENKHLVEKKKNILF